MAPAMLDAGAPSMPAMSRDKLVARWHLGHGFNTGDVQSVLAHCTAKDHELVVFFGEVLEQPWPQPQDPRNRSERSCPSGIRECFRMASLQGRFWRACFWQHAQHASFSGCRAQVLHFSNCQTDVVGYHNDARAFKDLTEFVDQLFFLCSIHSFTPVREGSPSGSVQPRFQIRNPDSSGPYGVLRNIAAQTRSGIRRNLVFPVSGRNYEGNLHPPSRTNPQCATHVVQCERIP